MRIYFDQSGQHDDNAGDAFSKIDPNSLPPELQSLYKEMQADYTRKTTELADIRKHSEQERQRFEEQLRTYGGMEQELQHWRSWYEHISANPEALKTGQQDSSSLTNQGDGGDELDLGDRTVQQVTNLQKTIDELKQQLESVQGTVNATSDRTGRMFAYHTQLSDLMREHPTVDRDKLVQHAVNRGMTDLKAAYEDLYRDDIINAEVEQRLETRLREERAKGITGAGRQVVVRPHTEGPRSFSEATQQILDQRASEGLLDLG
jgi:molecular chaperone GrpE (heat shock protein)